VLQQEHLINRVRELCHADARLVAALTYGSFAQGEGDAHSDIEFWLFFRPEDAQTADRRAWLDRLGTIRHVVVNEFGSHVVFFPNLIRGEFHFATADDISSIATWPARSAPTDQMVIVDRTGALRQTLEALPPQPHLPSSGAETEELCGRFANWLILAHHVSRRGELLRAIDALSHAQRYLLWMARLAQGSTGHWLTPSRRAEIDLGEDVIRAIHATAPRADIRSIDNAIAAAWTCGRAFWLMLANRSGREVPTELFKELDMVAMPHQGLG
jgi:lincosamide nucleotidyltransferase